MRDPNQGSIAIVELLDPQGRNPKKRPIVVVSEDSEIARSEPFFAVAITTTFPIPLTAEYVLLPWFPSGHAVTGLKKKCAAKCDWLVEITKDRVMELKGRVPKEQLLQILQKVAEYREE